MSTNPQGTTGKLTAWKTTVANLIVRDGFNVRSDMGNLDDLAQSIADNGVERALNVRRGKDASMFEVIDGHRRYAALQLAVKNGLITDGFEVPILIAERGMSDIEQLGMMARANDGKPLLPLEEAALFKRMVDAKTSIKDICKLVGHTDVYVRQHLDLLTASPEVHQALSDGSISKTLALNISTQARKGKLNAAELVAKATSGAAGKREANEAADPFQARQRAVRVKLDNIKETLADKKTKVNEALAEAGVSRADLKSVKHYALIRMLGEEAALRRLVTENTPEEVE